MTIRALAFDLDGTLVDSVAELAQAANAMRAAFGLPAASLIEVSHWVGNGIPVLIERALAELPVPPLDEASALFSAAYLDCLGQPGSLYPGVAETLPQLAARWPLAVITNKKALFTEPLLQRLGIRHHFALVVSGDTTARSKPDPLPLRYAAEQLRMAVGDWLMIGDSRNDMQAARAAGMGAVGLTYGYNYGEDIRLCTPDYCFDHFADLMRLVVAGD